MISESIQKLFIADFSAMMYWDNPDDKTSSQDTYIPQKVVLKVEKKSRWKDRKDSYLYELSAVKFFNAAGACG